MIQLVDKTSKKTKREPFWLLTFKYMIGDADGYTSEVVELSKDNPYIERFVTLVNSLKPTKGTWGLILDSESIKKCFKEGQITESDYIFIKETIFDGEEDEDSEDEYKWEFYEGVRSDTEYSFLVFQGLVLEYEDEYGIRYDTKIIKD